VRSDRISSTIFTNTLMNMSNVINKISSTTSQFLKPSAIKLCTFFYLSYGVNAQTTPSAVEPDTGPLVGISIFLGFGACLCCCFFCIDRILPLEMQEQEQALIINENLNELRNFII
jgi:hypothetical protein